MAEVVKRLAKGKYSGKVCETYLGIPKEHCERLFEKLYTNMKAAIEAA